MRDFQRSVLAQSKLDGGRSAEDGDDRWGRRRSSVGMGSPKRRWSLSAEANTRNRFDRTTTESYCSADSS